MFFTEGLCIRKGLLSFVRKYNNLVISITPNTHKLLRRIDIIQVENSNELLRNKKEKDNEKEWIFYCLECLKRRSELDCYKSCIIDQCLVVIIPLFVPISQLNILIPEQPYFKPLWVFFIYYHSHFPHSLTTVLILSYVEIKDYFRSYSFLQGTKSWYIIVPIIRIMKPIPFRMFTITLVS